MSTWTHPRLRFFLDRLGGMAVVATVVGLRAHWAERGLDAVGAVALRDAALSLALSLVVVSVAGAIGREALRALSLGSLAALEATVFGTMLGLGILGLVTFGLGLAGRFTPLNLSLVLIGCEGVFGPSASMQLRLPGRVIAGLKATWLASDTFGRFVLVLSGGIAGLALVSALSPAWDYDGLMYHLVGPQQFLQAGRIAPNTDNWYVNGAFSLELLFAYGLAFRDDVFPKLLHFSQAFLLIGAAYASARNWFGERVAWLSTAILLGVPVLPIWAGLAYIDLGWSAFEFMAIVAAIRWLVGRERRWLVLAGALTGFSMASKYLGLFGLVVLALLVLAADLRRGWRRLVSDGLSIGMPALLIAAPWYVKNFLWYGNPVYPLYFGGLGWDLTRLSQYAAYLDSFGAGKRPIDFLLLPWNVYVHHDRFGAMMNRIDIPSVLFPLLVLYPWVKRHKVVSVLVAVIIVRCALWSIGSQQLRFLLPAYPAMAVAAGYVASLLGQRLRPAWQVFLPALAVGLMVMTLAYLGILLRVYQPEKAILGLVSRREFLQPASRDFAAVRYVLEDASPDAKTLLLGDGRGYYCLPACIPDPDHFRWANTIASFSTFAAFERWARGQGIGQLLLSLEDLDFLSQHDPLGVMHSALDRIKDWRAQGCLPPVFTDQNALVLSIRCQ